MTTTLNLEYPIIGHEINPKDFIKTTSDMNFNESFKDKNNLSTTINEWLIDGYIGPTVDYTNLKQKIIYGISRINHNNKPKSWLTRKEKAWFKKGNNPKYLSLIL